MNPLKRISTLLKIGFAVGLLSLTATSAALAEFEPPDRGMPGRREGGGTRGCRGPIALLPDTNIGQTTAAYPKFFWSTRCPQATQATFSLYKGTEATPESELIYQTTFTPSGEQGIASLTLPSSAGLPPLEVGQDYSWSVAVTVNKKDLKTQGWITRVELGDELADQVAAADSSEQVSLYATNGLWFNTVETMADLVEATPNDTALVQRWNGILESVALGKLVDEPLLSDAAASSPAPAVSTADSNDPLLTWFEELKKRQN